VCRKIFLGSLALAMKDRETGKGKEGRGGERRGEEGRGEGRGGGGRGEGKGWKWGEVCFMVLGGMDAPVRDSANRRLQYGSSIPQPNLLILLSHRILLLLSPSLLQ
jgi:hypothetical protein